MKQMLALLLTAVLLSGCASDMPSGETMPLPTQPAANPVMAEPVTTGLAAGSDGTVAFNTPYPGQPGKDYTDQAFYTRSEFISAATGLKWAPHTWETTADRYILDYTTMGFYDFVLSEDGGYCVVDEMAQGSPMDVTADFVGRFGIQPGETARAWQIRLNPAACWDNGEKINADTYLYSYQQLLDGRMMNRRADSLYAGEFAIVGAKDYLYGKCGWEDVGIVKADDYTLVLITTAPIADPAFYVPYYLTSTYLVYEPLWERCKTCFDSNGNTVSADSDNIATISTSYCTSLDTSISYGPYRLRYFELDKQITLERNEHWYGYSDGRHLGQYQTDQISCQVIANHSTALLAFLKGDLDEIALQAADMTTYAASDAIRFLPETYTTKLTFNTDVKALWARGSQILANPTFRRAFALAIDRTRFASSYTSAGVAGYGLINEQYIYDPFSGAAYRQSPAAKSALVRLAGLDVDVYGSVDAASAAITGYAPELARQLMRKAYEEAVRTGLYDGESPITLQLSVYQSEDLYVQMYHFLQDALALACQGTPLEGKISLEMVVDEDYYATMESGLTDIIFSTWGGSAYEPYGILYRCYCDAGISETPNQMEYGFDSAAVTVQMPVDGTVYTHSLQDWARWCAGDTEITITSGGGALLPFRFYDAATRCAIFANLEHAYLSQYAVTPLYYRSAARLISRKGDYPTKDYHALTGFGDIRFYSYHYDDTQWQQVKGSLQY